MFSLEERSRAVALYLTTPMTTAQVVECPGYPTRQCLERWLAMCICLMVCVPVYRGFVGRVTGEKLTM